MSNVAMQSSASSSTTMKREREEDTGFVPPTAKFSKTSNKVVPKVVKVDLDSPPPASAQAIAVSVPRQIRTAVPRKVNWRQINNRDILRRLLMAPQNMTSKGSAYTRFDTVAYQREFGETIDLSPYQHLKVEGPWMLNIFGLSSREYQGKITHSVCYSTNDASMDAEVTEFAQFLALVDEVTLEHCVRGAVEWEVMQKNQAVKLWIETCTDETIDPNTGNTIKKINYKRLTNMVSRFFEGALRVSNKVREDKTKFRPVQWNDEAQCYAIPDHFFLKTKVHGKRNNDRLMEVSVFNQDGQPVFYGAEPALKEERATFVKPQLELPSYNFAQGKFYVTWVTNCFKFKPVQTAAAVAEQCSDTCDFDDQEAPVIADPSAVAAVRAEEIKFAKSDPLAAMAVDGDDYGNDHGGFD